MKIKYTNFVLLLGIIQMLLVQKIYARAGYVYVQKTMEIR